MRAYAIILDSYGYDHRENGLLVSIVKENRYWYITYSTMECFEYKKHGDLCTGTNMERDDTKERKGERKRKNKET